MEEVASEAIWARSLALRGVLERLIYFLDGEGSEEGCVLLLGYKGGNMPCNLIDFFMSVWVGLSEKVLKVLNQICFQISMGVKSLPLL